MTKSNEAECYGLPRTLHGAASDMNTTGLVQFAQAKAFAESNLLSLASISQHVEEEMDSASNSTNMFLWPISCPQHCLGSVQF